MGTKFSQIDKLKVSKESNLLTVTLKRPEAHNALDAELIKALTSLFREIPKDTQILAVLLSGEGPSFCAGGDLNWMRQSLKMSLAENLKDTQKLSDMYEAIFRCPVPVIGNIHGSVMGGGLGLTSVCDIVAADPDTKFCFSEVRLGLVPSIISPYVLRKTPETHVKPLMLTAEVFKTDVAQSLGLVHFVGSAPERDSFIQEKLNLIFANGPEAVRITKDLIHQIQTTTWSQRRKATVKTIATRRKSKEGQEGMNAFFEKRRPSWRSE